jgi:hypothetical protein
LGRGLLISVEPPNERLPKWVVNQSEETFPRISESTIRMQTARGFIGNTGTRGDSVYRRTGAPSVEFLPFL